MKTAVAVTLALSTFIACTAAQAQERQVTGYSGPMAIELPSSMLRGTTSAGQDTTRDAASTKKVRVVLQSPYGN